MAPEIMKVRIKLVKKQIPDSFDPFKADVYSFGLILWCLMSNAEDGPFPTYREWDAFSHDVINGHRPKIDPSWPPLIIDLIQQCWDGDPSLRPSWDFITFTLNEAIIDVNTYDLEARKFWKKHFFVDQPEHFLFKELKWLDFKTIFAKATGVGTEKIDELKPFFGKFFFVKFCKNSSESRNDANGSV
jgi:serine/threonine protein kinase